MITDEERRLSERLFALPLPPSTVDIGAAVTAGRRVRRWRAAGAGALAVLAVVGIGAVVRMRPAPDVPPATLVACQGQRLPLPPDVYLNDVVDVDPTGRYVVGEIRSLDNTVANAIRWDGTAFEVVPGERHQSPVTVSADGAVLGTGPGGGWRYADGRVDPLPVPAGYLHVLPRWTDGDGATAGYAFAGDGKMDARVVWRAGRPDRTAPITFDLHQFSGDDGTTVWLTRDRARLYVTTRAGDGHALDVPEGYKPLQVLGVAGDRAVGVVQPDDAPEPSGPGDFDRVVPVRWSLSTGAVDWRGDEGTVASSVSVDGTMVLRIKDRVATIRYPDGRTRRLAPPTGFTLPVDPVLSEDGTTVAAVAVPVGADGPRDDGVEPVVYRC